MRTFEIKRILEVCNIKEGINEMKKKNSAFQGIILLILSLMFFSACSKKVDPEQAKVDLGRTLYFDTRLSATGEISCNSCHDVMKTGTDNKPVSEGINGLKGTRNSPTVFNATFLSAQFWDGRAATLEEQAKGPLINPVEMGMKDHDAVVAVVKSIKGYQAMFENAFPDEKGAITIDTIAEAIADYERTLTSLNSPYDRYKQGDASAISELAKKGEQTFLMAGCISCHSGNNFAGPDLPKGQAFLMKFPLYPSKYDKQYDLLADKGKFEETKQEHDKHMWRVSPLRHVADTAPYFHNGKVETLEEAVRVMGTTQLNRTLTDTEVSEIVAFLKTLSGTVPKQTEPVMPQ